MIEPYSLATIADLVDRVSRNATQPGSLRRRRVVATLDVLAEDLVGRGSPEAVRLKLRIHQLVDDLCPGRELT